MDVALEELGAAKALDPAYPKLYNIYGLVYAMLGERAKAEENFQQAIALAPGDSEIRANWGAYLCAHRPPARSAARIRAGAAGPALQDAGDRADQRRQVQRRARADEERRGVFRRALGASPGNTVAAYNLALLAYHEARIGEARAWMRPVMQQTSPPPEALYLGLCIERKQGDREAERSYESQLRNRWPDSPEAKAIAGGACE